MTRWLKALFAWLAGWRRRAPAAPPAPFTASFDEDLPNVYLQDTLHVAGEEGSYWCAAMRCPCGCGANIHMSLLAEDEPSWRLRVDAVGRPTVSPSIWRKSGCRSHFFLRSGRIEWCPEERVLTSFNERA
jgi:uncharacterized protein DUF6527